VYALGITSYCVGHKFNSNDEEPAFGYARGPDEAKTWRDWLQTILLEQNGLVQISFEGSVETTLSEASDTVRLPGEGVQWAPSAEADTELEFQAIETPEHPKSDGRTRVTATDPLRLPMNPPITTKTTRV